MHPRRLNTSNEGGTGMKDQREQDEIQDELPFSHETLTVFQRVQQATSREERAKLMLELGARFAEDHDVSDSSATDDVHGYFEKLAQAKLAYEQAALRVGRLANECIQQYLVASNLTIEEATAEVTRSLN